MRKKIQGMICRLAMIWDQKTGRQDAPVPHLALEWRQPIAHHRIPMGPHRAHSHRRWVACRHRILAMPIEAELKALAMVELDRKAKFHFI
jgi:hypothetical protein